MNFINMVMVMVMELEVDGPPLSDHPWLISRVTGKDLDPKKHRHVLSSSLCGVQPNKFAKMDIFQ